MIYGKPDAGAKEICFPASAAQALRVACAAVLLSGAAAMAAPSGAPFGPASHPTSLPAPKNRPMPQASPPEQQLVTDEQIGQAIQRGTGYLYGQFGPLARPQRISAPAGEDPCISAGRDALAVYALLQCALATDDPRWSIRRPEVATLLESLKGYDLSRGRCQTYAHSLRAAALSVFNRPEDRQVLRADAQWLVDHCDGGAYTYAYADNGEAPAAAPAPPAPEPAADAPNLSDDVAKILGREPAAPPLPARPAAADAPIAPLHAPAFSPRPQGPWDNSNSQYGLLGVWAAAEAGYEVPDLYWAVVDKHWTDCQLSDGEWSYDAGISDGYLAMTCAGLASLLVTRDYLDPGVVGGDANAVGRDPFSPAVRRALNWFERGNDAMMIDKGPNRLSRASYTLFGLERVGLASGFKHFGEHDWYKLIAHQLVIEQRRDGAWGDGIIDTSYCLLCLARGRHPIVLTKLRFDGVRSEIAPGAGSNRTKTAPDTGAWVGYWDNRPRDAANLARFAGRQVEHPLNWQVVNIDRDWTEWNDGPLLELSSHVAPRFTDAEIDKLRQFIEAGGMLFTQADGGSEEFNAYASELARQLFPQYPLVDVPPTNPIYTHETVYAIDPRPPLRMVSNGARILMLDSPTDITRFWQQRDDIRHRNAFQLGVNLFVYAAGKRDLRNRLQASWVAAPTNALSLATIKLARIRYDGNWDPEPLAWIRYSNWLQRQTGYRIETQPVALADLKNLNGHEIPIADLTGAAAHRFTEDEARSLAAYVNAGGVVLTDDCGGSGAFAESTDALLNTAFPASLPQVLQANHPILQPGAAGMEDVTIRRLRHETAIHLGRSAGGLRIVASGKGYVLAAPLDITEGILGVNTTGILGYDPTYAQALVKNLLFWTLDR